VPAQFQEERGTRSVPSTTILNERRTQQRRKATATIIHKDMRAAIEVERQFFPEPVEEAAGPLAEDGVAGSEDRSENQGQHEAEWSASGPPNSLPAPPEPLATQPSATRAVSQKIRPVRIEPRCLGNPLPHNEPALVKNVWPASAMITEINTKELVTLSFPGPQRRMPR